MRGEWRFLHVARGVLMANAEQVRELLIEAGGEASQFRELILPEEGEKARSGCLRRSGGDTYGVRPVQFQGRKTWFINLCLRDREWALDLYEKVLLAQGRVQEVWPVTTAGLALVPNWEQSLSVDIAQLVRMLNPVSTELDAGEIARGFSGQAGREYEQAPWRKHLGDLGNLRLFLRISLEGGILGLDSGQFRCLPDGPGSFQVTTLGPSVYPVFRVDAVPKQGGHLENFLIGQEALMAANLLRPVREALALVSGG